MPAQRGAGRSLHLGLGDAQPTRIGEIFLLRREQAHLVNGSGLRQRADTGIVEHDLMRLGLTGLRGTRYNLRTFEIFSLISRRSLEAGAEHSLSLSKIDQPSRGREEQTCFLHLRFGIFVTGEGVMLVQRVIKKSGCPGSDHKPKYLRCWNIP